MEDFESKSALDMGFQLFEDNFEQKCFCVLLIDTSESMNSNGAKEELYNGLIAFRNVMMQDSIVCDSLEVAIVSFNSKVSVVQDPENVQNIKIPTLFPQGNGQVINAIMRAQELVRERTAYYESNGIPYYRPWLVLMSDGNFTWNQNLEKIIDSINADRNNKDYVFRILGVGNNIHEGILKKFESPDFPLEQLKNVDFTTFFMWLENSCGCCAGEPEHCDNNSHQNDSASCDWMAEFDIGCDSEATPSSIDDQVSAESIDYSDYTDDWDDFESDTAVSFRGNSCGFNHGGYLDYLVENDSVSFRGNSCGFNHEQSDWDNHRNAEPVDQDSWLDAFIIDSPTNSNNKIAYNHEPIVQNHSEFDSSSDKDSFLSRLFWKKNKSQSVYGSVFAPAEVAPQQHLIVQVYLHLKKETEMVKKLAIEVDKNTERRGYEPLEIKLRNGDNVEIELNINGNTLLYNSRKFVTWQGSFVKRSFDYLVPSNINLYELSCSVNIFVNGAIAGEMIFITKIVDSPRVSNTNVVAKPTKKIFISYSHKDIKSAEKIAKIHEALGIDVFFDKHRLKAGYIYSEEILNFIHSADTFVLCWSENAAESDYVEKERHEALSLAYPQSRPRECAKLKIYPYNIEPYAAPPADMIEHYHFEEL